MTSPDDEAPPTVIVYGTVCLDRITLQNDPASSREIPGGEAFNTATALAGWGVPVLLTGTALGTSDKSARLRALLDDPHVGLSRRRIPTVPGAVTPVCTITVAPDGERVMRGQGYREAAAPPPLPASDFASLPIFATDPNLGQPAVEAALHAAAHGCRIVAMDFQQHPEVVRVSHILQTSREGLARFPLPDGSAASLEASAQALAEMGAPRVIITDGEQGGVTAERQENGQIVLGRFSAFPIQPVDTTGAGDAFRAGLCWGLLQKPAWPLSHLVRFAGAAAALHCQILGSGSRLPLEDVLRLANSAGTTPTTRP